MSSAYEPSVDDFIVAMPPGYEEYWSHHAGRVCELLKSSDRIPLDCLDAIPELPGVYGVFYAQESPPWADLGPRPPFLDLLARADLPLYLGGVDRPATIRERVNDIAEFLDQARGISWSWFRAAAVPMEDCTSCDQTARVVEQVLGISPWAWMGFDRLFTDQYTEDSACSLVVEGTGFPSTDCRR